MSQVVLSRRVAYLHVVLPCVACLYVVLSCVACFYVWLVSFSLVRCFSLTVLLLLLLEVVLLCCLALLGSNVALFRFSFHILIPFLLLSHLSCHHPVLHSSSAACVTGDRCFLHVKPVLVLTAKCVTFRPLRSHNLYRYLYFMLLFTIQFLFCES